MNELVAFLKICKLYPTGLSPGGYQLGLVSNDFITIGLAFNTIGLLAGGWHIFCMFGMFQCMLRSNMDVQ